MRVSVLEAKLLTQTDVPAGARAKPGASFAGWAKRIGGPTCFPERSVDPRNRPEAGVADEEDSRPAAPSQLGSVPTSDGIADRPKRPRVEPDDLAALAVGEPDAPARDDDPDREPADAAARVIVRVAGSIRSTSPVSAAVAQT